MHSIAAQRTRAFYDLTKPGITRLVLVTTAAGFYMAARGAVDLILLLQTLLGTGLVASGTNALNQWVEREQDSQMRRTANRPIPSGRLASRDAVLFAWGISIAGMLYLTYYVNLATAIVVAASLGSYVFVYTPLKRKTWFSTIIGAVPGALPILAGWTASGQPIDAAACALFAILFLWQMPHFYALAYIYREDYGRAGFQMLTVVDDTGVRAARHSLIFTAVLIPISLLPSFLGVTGKIYLVGAAILGIGFLVMCFGMLRQRNEKSAWRIFTASIAYLPLLLALMVIDNV